MPKKFLTALAGDGPEPKVTAFWGKATQGTVFPAQAPMTLADFFGVWSKKAKAEVVQMPTDPTEYRNFKRSAWCCIFGSFKEGKGKSFARKDESCTARSVLALDFDDITGRYATWEALCNKLEVELGYKAYITPSLSFGETGRVHVWIPLDEPLTDKKAYKTAVVGLSKAFQDLGVLEKVDASSGTWVQLESLPLLTQLDLATFKDRALFQAIGEGKPILSTKKLLQAVAVEQALKTAPTDTAKDAQARGLLHADLKDGTSPAAIVSRWADAHKEWVSSYSHFLAPFFQIGYAEYVEGAIEHEQALDCMRALACGRADWAEENVKKYEQPSNINAFKSLELGHQKGLAFFYAQSQVRATSWLTFSEKGTPHIDYEGLVKDFTAENKLIVDASYPTGGALFDEKTKNWIELGWKTALQTRLSQMLFGAGVWTLSNRSAAVTATTDLGNEVGKIGEKWLDGGDPWLVAFANGKTWDTRSGEVCDTTAGDRIVNTLPWKVEEEDFHETREPRAVLSWLEDLFGEDLIAVDTFCDFIGYAAVRTQEPLQAVLFLTGSGANGKSTLIRYVRELFGEQNASSESIKDLVSNRFSTAVLWHKMVNSAADISAKYIEDKDILKNLSGGDSLRAEFKGQDPFSFYSYAKLLFACNRLPQVSQYDEAFARRMHIIDCPLELKGQALVDFALKHPMRELKSEQKAFLIYCIKHFVAREQEDKTLCFKDSKEMARARDLWLKGGDPLQSFLDTYCDYNEQEKGDSLTALYTAYCLACEQEETHEVKKANFKEAIVKAFGTTVSKTRGKTQADITRRVVGVTLTDDFFDEADDWRKLMTDRDSQGVQALLDTTEGYLAWEQGKDGVADTTESTTSKHLGVQSDIPF